MIVMVSTNTFGARDPDHKTRGSRIAPATAPLTTAATTSAASAPARCRCPTSRTMAEQSTSTAEDRICALPDRAPSAAHGGHPIDLNTVSIRV